LDEYCFSNKRYGIFHTTVTNKDCFSNKKIKQKWQINIVSPTKYMVGSLDHSQQSNLLEASA
jgi:hypothetical protein